MSLALPERRSGDLGITRSKIHPPVVQWEYTPRRRYSHRPQAETQEIRNAVTKMERG